MEIHYDNPDRKEGKVKNDKISDSKFHIFSSNLHTMNTYFLFYFLLFIYLSILLKFMFSFIFLNVEYIYMNE